MIDFWFQHLSAILSKRGVVAYLWRVAEDRFQWAGDLHETFGLETQDYPAGNAQLHKLLNPQQVPQRLAALYEFLSAEDNTTRPFTCRYKVRTASGTQVEVVESAILQADPSTGEKFLCGSLTVQQPETASIPTALVRERIAVLHESGLTQYGRRALQRRLEEWRGASAPAEGYLLAVGMDRLSLMNEAFGASYIDDLIDKTGSRLREIAGDAGSLTRIDGDVFGLFFPQAPASEMAAVGRYILNSFYDSPVQTGRGPVCVRVSIGGVSISSVASDLDMASMITKAETAMRMAKDRGRGCFVSYTEAAGQAAGHRTLIEAGDQFLRALKDDRVRLAFQPVIGTKSEEVKFHECLIRLLGPDGKLIPAGKFMPAIEKLGMSRLVDQYAMRSAIQELGAFDDLSLSVNVSNLTLTNPDWLRGVVSSLRDRPSIAERLIIEITESAVIKDMAQSIRVSKTLKELGCRVALDDFGTGYTSFSQIKDMEIDIVKIDKSFVRNMDDSQNKHFIRTLQSLADGVNVETVGEGAESMSDVKRLASDGVDYIQGYFYGFPRVERVWLPKDHVHRHIPLLASSAKPGKAALDSAFAQGVVYNA